MMIGRSLLSFDELDDDSFETYSNDSRLIRMIDSRLDSTCNVEQDQINKPANHSKAHITYAFKPPIP